MKITSLKKKDDENIILILDSGEVLYLSLEVVLKNNLRKEVEYDEEFTAYLINENRKYFIKKSALNFIARRLHSAKELKLKLMKKKYEKALIDDVLTELTEKKLINDEAFAEVYTDELLRKKSGKKKVYSALLNKGVDRETANKIVEEKGNEEEQLANAISICQKKFNIISKREDDKRKLNGKLFNHLISKGYSFDIAKEAIRQVTREDVEEE